MSDLIDPACLAVATIIQEAAREPYKGKVAVGRVIRNRMREKYHSDGTVAGTVLRAYQFSGWNTKSTHRIWAAKMDTGNATVQECQKAWVESADEWPELAEALLYHADAAIMKELGLPIPAWSVKEKLVAKVGRHLFFRK